MSFLQGLKPQVFNSLTAGLKACSTPWGGDVQGLKPQYLNMAFAALRGRSSTGASTSLVIGVC
jgi:hypothetical protein